MQFPVPAYTSFTIPTGATTGQRITFNEFGDGTIRIYNTTGVLVDIIGGPLGAIINLSVPGSGFVGSVQMVNGQLVFGDQSGGTTGAGSMGGDLAAGGSLFIDSGVSVTKTDACDFTIRAGTDNQTTGSPNTPRVILQDIDGTSDVDLFLSGSIIQTSKNGIPFTWQVPVLSGSFALGSAFLATYQNLQYRFDAQDNLALAGAFNSTAAQAAGKYTLFTLPAVYRPARSYRTTGVQMTSADAWVTAVAFDVLTTGAVQFVTPSAISIGDSFYIDTWVPLGDIS